ncbi:hypothetical protein [Phyllobacterium salinisoli]|uniref:hypothetical protein n=1 Tax=Phyllobacterium salinisoli TaxID=1899321 RepID=UPI001FDFA74A|nr:hypothetical protein [Phyllobacterium salinisoli]
MPTSDDLKGLMKFLTRDEWHTCFDEVLEDHIGGVLDADQGMELADLAEILGDHWASTLWGCAFEDFLTQQFEVEGGNIVDEYLKRRGWKEGPQSKAYMEALRTSVMSLYEVSDVVFGQSLIARDLIRGGEPILVSDGTATKILKQGDKIAARIVSVMGKNVLAGGLLPFTPEATEALFDTLRHVFAEENTKTLPAIGDEDLQAVAPVFTLSWLSDMLSRTMNMDMPSRENADGDEVVFHDIRFPLSSGVTQKDVAPRLDAHQEMSRADAKFWNWLDATSNDKNNTVEGSSEFSFDATMDNGQRVLGSVELHGRSLYLSVNSSARAERGIALIQQVLGDLVRSPLAEIRTLEQIVDERPGENANAASSKIPPDIAEQSVHQILDRQYHEPLDQSAPMLGSKTPRETAKTPAGRK